jgi:hypothetical protein
MSDNNVTGQVLTLSDCTVYTGRSCSQSLSFRNKGLVLAQLAL